MRTTLTTMLLALAGSAQAHITLEQPEAMAGSSYRAVFKVGHGCNGAATKEIIVTLPEGLRGAKPSPKPGWTLTTKRRMLKSPYDSHGQPIIDELAEVRWLANGEANQLQDAWYDEFVLRTSLPVEAGELAFAVRQVCTEGEWNWAERPTADNPRPRAPAVRLIVRPAVAAPAGHTH
ncbi:YcnI family protein [Roseateles sp. DXS20W]|uniref:YcnI family protein n=1 Tax=Pelomonas lactea TaxID=3299030 RepID=A0ABW7GJC5_9BURK